MSGNVLLTIQDRFANTRVTPIATPFLFWLQRVWCRIPCPKELRGARRLTFPTGRTTGGYLSGGLGQLVDGQKGPDNFRLDSGNGKGEFEPRARTRLTPHLPSLSSDRVQISAIEPSYVPSLLSYLIVLRSLLIAFFLLPFFFFF